MRILYQSADTVELLETLLVIIAMTSLLAAKVIILYYIWPAIFRGCLFREFWQYIPPKFRGYQVHIILQSTHIFPDNIPNLPIWVKCKGSS